MSDADVTEPTPGELLGERLRERHRPLGARASARYDTPGRDVLLDRVEVDAASAATLLED